MDSHHGSCLGSVAPSLATNEGRTCTLSPPDLIPFHQNRQGRRAELFITTKIWNDEHAPEDARCVDHLTVRCPCHCVTLAMPT